MSEDVIGSSPHVNDTNFTRNLTSLDLRYGGINKEHESEGACISPGSLEAQKSSSVVKLLVKI